MGTDGLVEGDTCKTSACKACPAQAMTTVCSILSQIWKAEPLCKDDMYIRQASKGKA